MALASKAIAGEINDAGGKAVAYQADVRDLASMERVIRQITDHFGRLTGVVNNAGIIRDKALMMMTDEDWRVVLETNLTGVFNTSSLIKHKLNFSELSRGS